MVNGRLGAGASAPPRPLHNPEQAAWASGMVPSCAGCWVTARAAAAVLGTLLRKLAHLGLEDELEWWTGRVVRLEADDALHGAALARQQLPVLLAFPKVCGIDMWRL